MSGTWLLGQQVLRAEIADVLGIINIVNIADISTDIIDVVMETGKYISGVIGVFYNT